MSHCILTIVLALFSLSAPGLMAQSSSRANSNPEDALKGFLRVYVGSSKADQTTQYSATFVDLRGDGVREAIVYLTSGGWCGTGGCTLLIVEPQTSSFRVVTKVTITRTPVRILATKSNGWSDLAVRVQGGGIFSPYEAKLSFDGQTYPTNPSMAPAEKLSKGAKGEVIFSGTTPAAPLF